MKIAIISDIHGNFPALEAVKERLEEDSPDKLICLGDIVGYYPWPVECTRFIRKNCEITILGNHDQVVLAEDFETQVRWFNETAEAALRWCRAALLKPQVSKEANFLRNLSILEDPIINDIHMVFTHGSPDDPWEYILYYPRHPDYYLEKRMRKWLRKYKTRLIAIGHTHFPFIFKKKNGYVLNPGSVGQPRDGDPTASFMLVNTKKQKLTVEHHRVKYDIEETCEGVQEANLPNFLCTRLFKGI
ncbi:MAG: metallophosphoesterase family protein [Candidatus Heimdallarchaeota archaeon]